MVKEFYIKVGWFGKMYGLNGGICILVEDVFFDVAFEVEVLFVLVDGSLVFYFNEGVFLESLLVIKLEDVDMKEAVKVLMGLDILLFVEEVEVEELGIEDFCLLEGFIVVMEMEGEIGFILLVEVYLE